MWGISSRLLQQSAATAHYLGRGHPSWLWTWSSSSRPSCSLGSTSSIYWVGQEGHSCLPVTAWKTQTNFLANPIYMPSVCFFEFLSLLWCGRDQAQPLYKYVLSLEGLPLPSAALFNLSDPAPALTPRWLWTFSCPRKVLFHDLSVLTVRCSFSKHSVCSTMSCWSAGFRPFRVR